MNIWLVSPAWSRYHVTELALAQRRWLCDELAARGHDATSVIVADDQNLDIARRHGFHTVELGNADLGAKFNAGYKYAARMGAEIFVHIGSDDWLHPDVFNVLDEIDVLQPPPVPEPTEENPVVIWGDGCQVIAQRTLTVADLSSGQMQRCRVRGSYGCIPWLVPRPALEPFGFAPIKLGLSRGIDGSLAARIRSHVNWVIRDMPADTMVDFKSETNLTPFGPLVENLGYGRPRSLDALADRYPVELAEMAKATQADLAAVAA